MKRPNIAGSIKEDWMKFADHLHIENIELKDLLEEILNFDGINEIDNNNQNEWKDGSLELVTKIRKAINK